MYCAHQAAPAPVPAAAAAAAAGPAGPAHHSRPVPYGRLRLCAPHCHGLPDFPTSHTRQAKLDLSVVFWGNLRPTFPNPSQPFPPHDTLESLLTTFGALSGSHFRGKLKLKSAAQGPGVFALCRERYTSDLSPTVSLRLSTPSAPSPQSPSIRPSSSSSQHPRHALPAMNLACSDAVAASASTQAPGVMLARGSHTLAPHPPPTQASTRSFFAPYLAWDPSSSSSSSSCYPPPLLP